MHEVKNHTDLLNYISRKIKAQWYLEIGVANGKNFEAIQIPNKRGVDPDPASKATLKITSNHFWNQHYAGGIIASADLIFIDGLHHADQVKVDISHAYEMLEDGGVIVVHDCNPDREEITHVPRDSKEWCGDVYKAVCSLNHPGLFTIDFDYGCTVLRKTADNIEWGIYPEPWEFFDENRKQLLNLKAVEEGLKIIDTWT